jgi:hypothetical protein
MNSEELKPCPFCRAIPEVSQARMIINQWKVTCRNLECAVVVDTLPQETKEQAIAAWNRRAE